MRFLEVVLTVMVGCQVTAVPGTPAPVVPSWCPVTFPNEARPADVEPETGWYGEDGLYTNVKPDGTYNAIIMLEKDGAWNKRIWVREPPEPTAVTMRFIGDRTTPGEPVVTIPAGYERTTVQATDTWFPEPGCWAIMAFTPTRTLEIVVWVIFVYDEGYGTPVPSDQE